MSRTSKNRSSFSKVICLFCLIPILLGTASAHPGKTDADGGHHDYENQSGLGSYHYHHGYPAHLHENGLCPYDFDDKTGWNSGTSGNGSSKDTSSSSSPAKVPSAPQQKDFPLWGWILIGAFALYLLGSLIKLIVTAKTKKRQERELRQRYQALYGGKTAEELCGMPEDTQIGADGLPKEKGAADWGAKYTFYRSRTGKTYHRAGCHPAASIPVHAVHLLGLKPCQKCHPQAPDMTWFQTYKRIKEIKQKYKIP